ncbi:hypothetical protein [Paraburkholderia sp. BL6665CI2N2]|uniref:hypothetical protein n=1 Tax=Paraburkholderia sp. BL6665CI2N2 TaxID=1938806 RepID=UPI001065E13E|nr:hypothetical protein [Paraburkholderia sp. BL6665CI2N2]
MDNNALNTKLAGKLAAKFSERRECGQRHARVVSIVRKQSCNEVADYPVRVWHRMPELIDCNVVHGFEVVPQIMAINSNEQTKSPPLCCARRNAA